MSWQTLGFGDFAGNPNEANMLMRDSNTGNIDYFDIRSSQIVGAGPVGSIGTNWQVLGLGDFSGNANGTDMILRDSNTGNMDYDIQHNQTSAPARWATSGRHGRYLAPAISAATPTKPTC